MQISHFLTLLDVAEVIFQCFNCVTLKMGSKSSKSNEHFFFKCICIRLVKIHPLIMELEGRQNLHQK